jgi:hypothetical protein
MEPKFTFVLAASFLILAVTATSGLPASAFEPPAAGLATPSTEQEQGPKKLNITGKIEAVDAEMNTVRVVGTSETIMVTPTTRYASGLSFASLKAGLEVKIVAVARGEGKVEALEVSTDA